MNETQIQKRFNILGRVIMIVNSLFSVGIILAIITVSSSLIKSINRRNNFPNRMNQTYNFDDLFIIALTIFGIFLIIFSLFTLAGYKLSNSTIAEIQKNLKFFNVLWIILIIIIIVPSFLFLFLTIYTLQF